MTRLLWDLDNRVTTLEAGGTGGAFLNLKSDFGATGDGTTNDAAAVQAWINACSSATSGAAPKGHAPTGTYYCGATTINFPSTFIEIEGSGKEQSKFTFAAASGGCFKAASMTYFKPHISNLAIEGDASSGSALDLTQVTNEVYEAKFSRLNLKSGEASLLAPRLFSASIDDVSGWSYNSHTFLVACGPAVSWRNCYPHQSGTNKAGFRLAGTINLDGCNGVDSNDWWGVFGCDTTASDGFQTDFASLDYPDVTLIACNIENFNKGGLYFQNACKRIEVLGGNLDRSAQSSAYDSLIRFRTQPTLPGNPARFAFGAVAEGSGVPNGGAGLTNAWVYCPGGSPTMLDLNGNLANAVGGYYSGLHGGLVPIPTMGVSADIYQDTAVTLTALMPRRLTVQTIRYDVLALTPSGSNQTIDITGHSKATLTPAAACSISAMTFATGIGSGAGTDWSRNGYVLVEAGNGNVTLNHSASGADTLRLPGGAALAMSAGQVVQFFRSETTSQWVYVDLTSGGGGVSDGDKGDITVSGTGTVWTVDPQAITYAKVQNVTATDRLLGRATAGAGGIEEIACTAAGRALLDDLDAAAQRTTLGLGTLATQSGTFSGTASGTNTGDQTITLTTDVTGSGTGSFAATIASNAVSNAKLADVPTATFKGRTTAGTGDPEDLTVAQAKALLNLTGTNSGDQTSIAGITGTIAQFNTACTDADFATGGGTATGTNTGDQSLFSTIAVSGQSNVVADAASDTLTLVAGTNITITTDAATDTITINASGGGGGGSLAFGTAVVDFGAFPGKSDASVAVTGQASIVAGSYVQAALRPVATADHSADEHLVETIKVMAGNIVAGTGFTIYALNDSQLNEPLTEYGQGRNHKSLGTAAQNTGSGANTHRGSVGGQGTRIYGQWTVGWAWN